ncbi:MAG TPA: hypothetical protein VGF85_06915 [Opitutaceae bacterium]|jgi:uncharacterized membrane protein
MALWAELRKGFQQPEYLHTLLNPIPVYGLAFGVLAGFVAWATGSRAAKGLSLLLIFLASLSAWPVEHFGSGAYDRVYSMSGAEAQKWLNWHQHLGERAAWACYAAALFAACGLYSLWKLPRLNRLTHSLSLVFALIALGFGAVAAFAGGRIRHSEFRNGPPPQWADTSSEEN